MPWSPGCPHQDKEGRRLAHERRHGRHARSSAGAPPAGDCSLSRSQQAGRHGRASRGSLGRERVPAGWKWRLLELCRPGPARGDGGRRPRVREEGKSPEPSRSSQPPLPKSHVGTQRTHVLPARPEAPELRWGQRPGRGGMAFRPERCLETRCEGSGRRLRDLPVTWQAVASLKVLGHGGGCAQGADFGNSRLQGMV